MLSRKWGRGDRLRGRAGGFHLFISNPSSYATGHPAPDASDGVGLDRSRTSAGVGGEHPAAAVAGQLGFGQREQRARRLGSDLSDSPGGSEQLHVIVFLRSGSEFELELELQLEL